MGLPLHTTTFSRRGLLRVVPSQLARNAALEGEVACRQLARHKAFKSDSALVKSASRPPASQASVTEIYHELVAWVEELFHMADPNTLVAGVSDRLCAQPRTTGIKVLARLREKPENHRVEDTRLTPGLALYVAAATAFTVEHVLKLVGRVVEREPSTTEATPAHLWSAVKEDEGSVCLGSKPGRLIYIDADLIGILKHLGFFRILCKSAFRLFWLLLRATISGLRDACAALEVDFRAGSDAATQRHPFAKDVSTPS